MLHSGNKPTYHNGLSACNQRQKQSNAALIWSMASGYLCSPILRKQRVIFGRLHFHSAFPALIFLLVQSTCTFSQMMTFSSQPCHKIFGRGWESYCANKGPHQCPTKDWIQFWIFQGQHHMNVRRTSQVCNSRWLAQTPVATSCLMVVRECSHFTVMVS